MTFIGDDRDDEMVYIVQSLSIRWSNQKRRDKETFAEMWLQLISTLVERFEA